MPHRIVFFGTSDFSIPSLRALLADQRFEVVAVVTKPDQPIGRHQTITPPPVKTLAQEHSAPVYQFEKIKTEETFETLRNLSLRGSAKQSMDCRVSSDSTRNDNIVDAYVVVSYGKIIPQRILDLPKRGCVNVHGSLLPRWRGASCVQAAIAAGDEKSGVTIMMMDAEMDHGDILAQAETTVGLDETGGTLHDRLAQLGADNLPDVLADYLDGKVVPKPQNHDQATFCKLLSRDDGKIDWSKPAEEIERLVRAYDPWPGTWTEWDGKRIKILASRSAQSQLSAADAIGTLKAANTSLLVKCGDGNALEILELQPEGKKAMPAKEYLAGHTPSS